MDDLTISKGWFQGKGDDSPEKKKFCEHRASTVTLDYEVGIEYCSFCGALGHYNPELDALEWTLPEHLQKQNYNQLETFTAKNPLAKKPRGFLFILFLNEEDALWQKH